MDYPTCGKVLLEGQDVLELDDSDLCQLRKRKIGMVFQNYYLLPHRSVLENVLFRFRYLDHDRCDAERRALQALEAMDLADIAQRPARLLSGGEMQRVAIARALVLEPRLLLADEPTGNLDWDSANVVMNCFRELNEAGMTIVMVTHNEALLEFGTRHLVCRAGSIQNGLS